MFNKADFTAEEWQNIMIAPEMASIYISLASPGGIIGAFKEMIVFSKLMVEAEKTASDNALINAVAADFKGLVERKEKLKMPEISKRPEEIRAQCIKVLSDLVASIEEKAPAEAEGYKRWVYKAAVDSAEAAKEGGFLGFGGVKVTEAETAALKEITSVLGITV